ncbi:hypothetical protein [Achromobacter spanius]|uniref:hypothetical protein n=1 Tax=Achromobacter spanius TaxID=217203 RepID=UPI0037FBC613
MDKKSPPPQFVTTAMIDRQQAAHDKYRINTLFVSLAWPFLVLCFFILGPDGLIKELSGGSFHEQMSAIVLSLFVLVLTVLAPIAVFMWWRERWCPLDVKELTTYAELAFKYPEVDKHWEQHKGERFLRRPHLEEAHLIASTESK